MSDDLFAFGTVRQAAGAWPNGTRVVKTNSKPDDRHADGARARVMGSRLLDENNIGYCLEWDDLPGIPIWIIQTRLRKAAQVGTCRVCGCTDDNACVGLLTGPCSWVEPDLCSSCRCR